MTIRHVFSNQVADAVGTLTVWNGATTASVAATDVVRPSDWNSAHELASTIAGNTAGVSTLSGTNIVLAGGNNITLSANGQTISVVGGAGAAGNTGYLSAGTTNASLGTVSLANGGGVTWGIDGQTVTASVRTDYLTTAMASNRGSDFVQATAAFNGTNASGTIASNAISVSVAPQSVQPVAASAANGSAAFSTLSFSNANGVSFSTGAGPSIVASHNGLTSQSNQNVTAANGGFAFQTLSFSNLNGVSFGTSAGSAITASHNGLTSQSNQNVTAANGGFAFQTLSFSNLNGISFGTSAGSAITASHNALTTARASNDAIGLNTAQSNVTWTVNSSGLSLDARGYAGTNTTFNGANVSGSMTVNSNGVNLSLSAAAGGGGETRFTGYAVGNTTQSTTGTIPLSSVQFRGEGIVSAGVSNGSVVVSATQSNQAFSAAGGSSAFQTLGFSDNAYASWTNTNGSVALTELRASLFAVSNTTQSSSGTQNIDAISFAGAGIASVGVTNGSVVISVPAGGGGGDGGVFAGVSNLGNTAGSTGTVSTGNLVFVGSNGVSLSQSTGAAGSAATITFLGDQRTISHLAVQPFGGMAAGIPFAQSSLSLGQNSLYLYPFQLEDHLTADHVKMPVMLTNSSSAAASIQKGYTYRLGLFTRVNATQISRLYSTSYTMAASHNSNVSWAQSMITAIGNSTSYNTLTASSAGINLSSSLHGPRELIMPISTLLTPGEYWVGLVASTSSVGGAGSVLQISNIAIAVQTFNRPGLATNTTNRAFYNDLAMGLYSATTGAIPASIGMTQVNLNGSQPVIFFGSGTA